MREREETEWCRMRPKHTIASDRLCQRTHLTLMVTSADATGWEPMIATPPTSSSLRCVCARMVQVRRQANVRGRRDEKSPQAAKKW